MPHRTWRLCATHPLHPRQFELQRKVGRVGLNLKDTVESMSFKKNVIKVCEALKLPFNLQFLIMLFGLDSNADNDTLRLLSR